jgi:putative endonuclease
MYYTYVLQSEKERIRQHNSGKSTYTAKHRPYKLVYYEKYDTKDEALERERYFKTPEGKDYILNKL